MGLTEALSSFVVKTKLENIPVRAVKNAKATILDCLGVTLAGSREPGVRKLAELVRENGGYPEASVIGLGLKTSTLFAALVNGAMTHVLDYDDSSESMKGHPSGAVLSTVLALGERMRASGKEILEAYILGVEAETKIGSEISIEHYEQGWHATATLGTIGAVVAASKILKLNTEETRMALGIASSTAGGLRQNFGTMTKPLHVGNAAKNGLVAALLARKGFTADKNVLESPFGFCKTFSKKNEYNFSKISEKLGNPFDVVSPGIIVKKYPCCRSAHAGIEAITHLIKEYEISPEEVKSIKVKVNQEVPGILIHNHPKTGLEGKFSMQFCVAIALLDGEVGLRQFSDKKVLDEGTQELMRKVEMYPDPQLKGRETVVTVKLKDGKEYSYKADEKIKGHPENPLTRQELISKYQNCARLVLPEKEITQSINLVENLEELSDINELTSVMANPEALGPARG